MRDGRRIGVYPGTFDPVTLGHMDVIRRATRVVDHLIVGVAENAGKGPLFSVQERMDLVKRDIEDRTAEFDATVEVQGFKTLLMHFAVECGARVIVRGLRAVSDFEYEFQMAGMNARLDPTVETMFLMASDRFQFISSRFVKEIGKLGGDISQFVSAPVKVQLQTKFSEQFLPAND